MWLKIGICQGMAAIKWCVRIFDAFKLNSEQCNKKNGMVKGGGCCLGRRMFLCQKIFPNSGHGRLLFPVLMLTMSQLASWLLFRVGGNIFSNIRASAAIYGGAWEMFRHSLAEERRRRVQQAVSEVAVDRPGLAWSLLNTELGSWSVPFNGLVSVVKFW